MANGAALPWKDIAKYGGFGGALVGPVLVVWLAIAQPMRDDFQEFQKDQRETAKQGAAEMSALRQEFTKFRVEFTEWSRQVFVSRDLFDAMKDEMERRVAALEKK
ncbi:MAG: hypothetical protein ACHQ1G_07570 [Planctomycetota bacterium]